VNGGGGDGGEGRLPVGKLVGEVGLMWGSEVLEECEALLQTQSPGAWKTLMPWLWPLFQDRKKEREKEKEREVLVYWKGDRGWFIGADAGILCGFYWYVNKICERRLGKWVFPC